MSVRSEAGAARGLLDHPVVQLTLARSREFGREPEAVFWVFVFPIVFALALALAFRTKPPEPIPVGVLDGIRITTGTDGATGSSSTLLERLRAAGDLDPRPVGEEEARLALRSGKLAAVVVAETPLELWLDPGREESRGARLAIELALSAEPARTAAVRESREAGSRYIDFFVPGLLGMNLMGTGMWAIGFALVQQRQGGLLKRFIASPMKRWHFLVSQIGFRLIFLAAESGTLLVFAYFLLDVPLRGSLLLLTAVAILGAMTFVGLGLLIASRARTIEGVSGLMNLVMVPMWVGSGIFFSTERFPESMQPWVGALPLTALNDALRAVMLDGAGVAAIGGELGLLALWGSVTFFAALKLFRWQ